jgi:hypothetical protein
MDRFRLDVFSWIPQPEVENPIATVAKYSPRALGSWGPGACGPYFGGDNFTTPPLTPDGWQQLTFRARQGFGFQIRTFGDVPVATVNTGVIPGTTTVLTEKRSKGGRICHKMTASVNASSANVRWLGSERLYQVELHGAAQDPVPAEVGAQKIGAVGGKVAAAMTPNLSWDLRLFVQTGTTIPALTRARYFAMSDLASLDLSKSLASSSTFGGTTGLVHGTITVRRFPSYVVYLTIQRDALSRTLPIYFADATDRNPAKYGAFVEITVGHTDSLRRMTW